jgi:murein DD-endopeptidase MepM/ murein hydrolase activator NlpD
MLVIALAVLALGPSLPAPPCLYPPVAAPVVDPYREPPCPWCPGNRGLTYVPDPGTVVRAASGGRVTFSGSVAGKPYVVVDHGDGLRATYGGLTGSTWEANDRIDAGAIVGRSTGGEVHFGIRRGEQYVDPAPLLGRLVQRPRLVPTDGTAARPAPPPRLRCPVVRPP